MVGLILIWIILRYNIGVGFDGAEFITQLLLLFIVLRHWLKDLGVRFLARIRTKTLSKIELMEIRQKKISIINHPNYISDKQYSTPEIKK